MLTSDVRNEDGFADSIHVRPSGPSLSTTTSTSPPTGKCLPSLSCILEFLNGRNPVTSGIPRSTA